MGAEGKSWREILAFYYPGSVVAKTASGLQWTRLGGETVALFSTQPDRDRVVLGLAERLAPEIAARTGLTVPAGIELRVYPDVDSFRNGTGEPGWVAAHTTGRRVELQPVSALQSRGALESTLRHEVTHVLLEATAAPGLPVWFREGLAGYLSGGEGVNGQGADGAIAQRASEGQAREANRAAVARVAALVRQNGLPAVIGWLRAGLPR
jgi:stage II sporulation protein D